MGGTAALRQEKVSSLLRMRATTASRAEAQFCSAVAVSWPRALMYRLIAKPSCGPVRSIMAGRMMQSSMAKG